jgi:hypothetical protein
VVGRHQRTEEARKAFETAKRLGSRIDAATNDAAYLTGLFSAAPFHSGPRQE